MPSESAASVRIPLALMAVALVIIPLNYGVWWLAADNRQSNEAVLIVFRVLAVAQFACGVGALVTSVSAKRRQSAGDKQGLLLVAGGLGLLAALGAIVGGFVGLVAMKIP